jgi:NADPH:quinone reductase-like Zn-dependent oxidoreductase/SAM-dependent methyltransferase
MMVVTSSEDIIKEAVTDLNRFATSFGINVACYNSPKNVTVAGERHLIDQLMARLKETNTFARQLRLPIAYHSRQMCQVSQEYRSMIGTLSKPLSGASNLPMVSSVTGKLASSESLLDPSYWTTNMESPVLFSQAVINMYAGDSPDPGVENFQHLTRMVDHFVEIGPHSSLRSTLREILQASSRGQSIGYTSLLVRGQSATRTTSTAMGSLYSLGVPVNLRAVNEPSGIESSDRCLLVNLPEYPFDHSRGYWHESRLSRNYRLRRYAPSEFLGVRSRDWNTSEGRWRHFLKTTDIPWIEHHIINGAILYPAGGMLAMAIEAAKQMTQASSNTVVGYTLRDVQFQNPIDLTDSSRMVEVETSLRPLELPGNKSISYDFKINTYANDDYEVLNCHGYITVEVVEATSDWIDKKTRIQRRKLLNTCSNSPASEERSVDFRHMYSFLKQQCGFDYGPFFQVAEHQRYYNNGKQVSAEVRLFSEANEDHVIHPITLDAFFHLPLTAITSGGSQPTATSIPTHVDYLWVAATGLAFSSEQQTAKAFATVTEKTKRGFTCNGIGVSNVESDDVRLWYYGLKLTSITADPAAEEALPNPNQSFLNIDCKVCLDKLEPNEVHNLLNSRHPNNQDLSGFFQDLALLVEVSLDRFVRSVSFSASHSKDPWKPHFWNWAQHHCSEARRRERWDNPESEVREASANFESLLDRVGNSNPIGRLYVVVASNLVAFWNGSADPLELLMHSNLLKECYEHWNNNSSSMQISEYMDLLAHQNPGMNILEVGGGTGSGTRNLVAALSACSGERGGVLRCHRYDFTDVSASFFGQAKEEFNTFLSQMTFGVLDIERDWVEQEYASGFYDVVIAVSVVHISSHLEATIQRVRKALKPGGKFVMQEAFTPSGWTLSYVFGLFPGWWFGVGDDRVLSPSISISEWDTLLKANGFSGVDLVRDLGHEGTFHYGWIISTATEAQPLTLQPTACPNLQISILLDEGVPQQALFADALSSQINSWTSVRITRKNIQDPSDMVSHQRNSEEFVIFLADYSQSHIKSLNEVTWEVLRDLFGKLRRFLWITTGGGRLASPEYAMLDGLARTLRLEHEELHLVTLGLEEAGSSERQVSHAVRVLKEMTLRLDYQNYEQEYIEVDGLLHTRRLVEATYLKSAVDARVNPLACIPTRLDSSARFYAAMGITRSSKSPCYVPLADPEPGGPELDCVEVAVKAVALEGQDNPSTPARNENHKLGSSFAGIVTKSGTSSQFHPGNRVFGVHPDSLRSHVRLSSQSLTRIPAALAFSEACSLMPPFAIAFTALVEIGHVRSTDSILVHGGDTPVGLAALRLLLRQDVKDLWVTADDEISSHRVSEQLQIPWGRFLPRNWFSIFSMSASQWRRRFDVVFSAEETSPSILSLDHVRPGGRYVTLQYNSTLNKNADMQRIHGAPAGVTLSTIDPSVTILSQESLRFAAAMASSSNLALAREQAKLFPASSLPEAFDALRGLPGGEYAVIGFEEYDTIDVRAQSPTGAQ